jgi:carboxylesterase
MPLTPYMQGAEPYFHRGGPIGVLGLHGFTASPAEIRWMGEHLAAQGMTVYTPRLPGHGTQARDLARTHWQDWYAAAVDGYHILRAQCDSVFVAGHSLGGMLGLLLAAEMPIDGLAVLAAPIVLQSKILKYTRWLKYVVRSTNQGDKTAFPQRVREEQARRGEPELGRVRYDEWYNAAVYQLYALSLAVYEHLPQVTPPLLLLYSLGDVTVPPAQGDVVANRVASKTIERHTLQTCDHILPQDVEREQVFALVTDFIQRHA